MDIPESQCVLVSPYDLGVNAQVSYKVVQTDYSRQLVYIVRTDYYPLMWLVYWFKFRLIDTWAVISTALSYVISIWFSIPVNPAETQNVRHTLKKLHTKPHSAI
jgi:hypothetical protein